MASVIARWDDGLGKERSVICDRLEFWYSAGGEKGDGFVMEAYIGGPGRGVGILQVEPHERMGRVIVEPGP